MRRGFTLAEILVSLGIFSVVGAGLVAILTTATTLFQRTESARAGGDEAAAALALLREDLRRIIAERDGGWIHARIQHANGNGLLAFAARSEDPQALRADGRGGREVVMWWVHEDGRLLRDAIPWPRSGTEGLASRIRGMGVASTGLRPATPARLVSRGCLHFSPWLCAQQWRPANGASRMLARPRSANGQPEWEQRVNDQPGTSQLGPWYGRRGPWETSLGHRSGAPWPDAVRIAVTFAGGTLSATSADVAGVSTPIIRLDGDSVGTRRSWPFLAADLNERDDAVVLRGDRGLPLGPARIGHEWVEVVNAWPGGATVRRGMRRSQPVPHPLGADVLTGDSYAIVWRLMH